jgi:hypothetical protein
MKSLAAAFLLTIFLLVPFQVSAQDSNLVSEYTPIASYQIRVDFDPQAKHLSGKAIIQYTNTTSDPIPELVFHLYLNAFRDSNTFFLMDTGGIHRSSRWVQEQSGWMRVLEFRQVDGTLLPFLEIEDGTLGRASLPEPIAPGETGEFEVVFAAKLPQLVSRTGFSGDFFMIGQWFPKLGVWENGGWNAHPFHGNSEFYADFGTYEVEITLPETYRTAGSGVLVSSLKNEDGSQTVSYRAEGVIDFAWAASPHFLEASRLVEDIELVYVYLPEHAWTTQRVLDAAEGALRLFGDWYGPYPYSRFTIVDVPDDGLDAGGMEYPTLVTAGTAGVLGPGRFGLILEDLVLESVVIHETGHQWWQSMVAFNEAEEPWLDEGFTDYSTTKAIEHIYGKESAIVRVGGVGVSYRDYRRMEYLSNPRVPMYGAAWEFTEMDYTVAAYSKPVVSLLTLEGVLGEDAMLEVMKVFFQRYRFAHPGTEDFRATAEEVTGLDLGWFFDGLVYGEDIINYSVASLDAESVTVLRQGELAVPVKVLVSFADGSQVLESWDGWPHIKTFEYPGQPEVRLAEIDPGREILVDMRWIDNGLSSKPDIWSWLAVVVRMLYQAQNLLLSLGGL